MGTAGYLAEIYTEQVAARMLCALEDWAHARARGAFWRKLRLE